jgi:hypothetical protein
MVKRPFCRRGEVTAIHLRLRRERTRVVGIGPSGLSRVILDTGPEPLDRVAGVGVAARALAGG